MQSCFLKMDVNYLSFQEVYRIPKKSQVEKEGNGKFKSDAELC